MGSCEGSVEIWSEVKADSTHETQGWDGLRGQVRVVGLFGSRYEVSKAAHSRSPGLKAISNAVSRSRTLMGA